MGLARLLSCAAAAALLTAGTATPRAATADPARAGDALPPSAPAVLRTAFANRYDVDTLSRVEFVMRNRSGQARRREFQIASKIIEGQLHAIGRLVAPPHLRGMTVMVIEVDARRHDTFVFFPSLHRVRRITSAQRGDAFLGSDLTYEDFERQRAEDYQIEFRPGETVQGEPAWVIRGHPHRKGSYAHVDFAIAKADHAILEARYFKRGAEEPYRLILAPREAMTNGSGHVLPLHLLVENRVSGTSTEVVFENLEIDPEIDDRLFSVRTLEQEKPLPQGPGQADSEGGP